MAKLTDTAAGALNEAFKVDAIKAGTPLGVVRLVAKGDGHHLQRRHRQDHRHQPPDAASPPSVTLDAGTAEALESLGVAVAPVGSATFDAATGDRVLPDHRWLRRHPLRPELQAGLHRRHGHPPGAAG